MKILARFMSIVLLYLFAISNPVLAEDITGQELFPIYGVVLGKTTIKDLKIDKIIELENGLEIDGSIILDSVEFGCEDGIIESIKIDKNGPMPSIWEKAGFHWDLSYQSWITLLEKLGFKINTIQAPTLQMKTEHPVFEGEFEAFFPSDHPIIFTFSFKDNYGTGITSGNVLDRIKACYIRDFKEFAVSERFINKETASLNEQKRKALALTGITSFIEGLNHEKLELSVLNQANTEYWKKVLMEEWKITKRNQLIEQLTVLESKGDSGLYLDLVKVLNDNQSLNINQIGVKLNYQDFQVKRLYYVKEKQELLGSRTLRAWDYSRMALLCRIGYQVGFLTANEAWIHLQRINTKVESLYQSWEDFASNYIMGLFFSGLKNGMQYQKVNQALQAYAELIITQGNAWGLNWKGNNPDDQFIANTINEVVYYPSVQYRAWTCYLYGSQCYENGKFDEALDYYQEGLALDPEFKDLWLLIGIAYSAKTDFAQAVNAFSSYILENQTEYLPRIYLGEVYEKTNQIQEAIDEYNEAIDLDDTKPEGFLGLGRIAISSGDYELATSYLRIAESLYLTGDESIFYTLYLLGYSYYKTEKFDKALSYFLRAYGNYRDDMYLNYYLGVCYLYNQNINLASNYLQHAEELGLIVPQEIKELLTAETLN